MTILIGIAAGRFERNSVGFNRGFKPLPLTGRMQCEDNYFKNEIFIRTNFLQP